MAPNGQRLPCIETEITILHSAFECFEFMQCLYSITLWNVSLQIISRLNSKAKIDSKTADIEWLPKLIDRIIYRITSMVVFFDYKYRGKYKSFSTQFSDLDKTLPQAIYVSQRRN